MNIGSICWTDLTVENAADIRDFYKDVVGWTSSDHPMGDYDDYCVHDDSDTMVAGICHARGANSKVPPHWLVYMNVADLEASSAKVVERGGEIIEGPRSAGDGRIVIFRDPAGAVAGLYQKNT